MRLFKSKGEKQLDAIINSIEMNMSNNYKDNAQDGLKEFEVCLCRFKEDGILPDKVINCYEELLLEYKEKMRGYSHKDQKPYWT